MVRKRAADHLQIGILLMMAVLVMPSITTAGTSDQGLKPSELKGVIFSLDAEEGRVVIEKPLGSHVPILTRTTTKIFRDGKRVNVGALQVGDKVRAEWLPGPRIAREIWAFSNTEQ
jgi:hypothetical protein